MCPDSGVEVALQIPITREGAVVREPAVELDDDTPVVIVHIAESAPARRGGRLADRCRKHVGAFDLCQVPVFEDGAGAFPYIREDAFDEGTPSTPQAFAHRVEEPLRGGRA